LADADQPEQPDEPVDWDVLPNGLLIVQYDQDRYVYQARATPLFFSDDPHQNGRWTARPASAVCAICAE